MRADWDDDLAILSSENVSFAIETAGLGTRFAAVMIDMSLQFLVLSLLAFAAFSIVERLPPASEWTRWLASFGSAVMAVVVFLVVYAYFFFFEWLMDGQTPGKRSLHLRVLQTSAMPITMWAALTRNVLRLVDFLPFFYGVGALVAVINPHNRRVGDLVAGTVVARERPHGARRLVLDIDEAAAAFLAAGTETMPVNGYAAPALVVADGDQNVPLVTDAAAPAAPVAARVDVRAANLRVRLDSQDYELIREFLLRRETMQSTARQRLAQSLTLRICQKLGEPLPGTAGTEAFLEHVASSLQENERVG